MGYLTELERVQRNVEQKPLPLNNFRQLVFLANIIGLRIVVHQDGWTARNIFKTKLKFQHSKKVNNKWGHLTKVKLNVMQLYDCKLFQVCKKR